MICYCCDLLYCVYLGINTDKHTGWDHDELSVFGPNLIGCSTVVGAKVALRLWIDLRQIK